MVLPQTASAYIPATISGSGQSFTKPHPTTPELKQRKVHRTDVPQTTAVQSVDFSTCVLRAVSHMPQGGGYSVKATAAKNLSTKAVVWDETAQKLAIDVQAAQPSFCSGASYLTLLHALEIWQTAAGKKLPAAAWKAMDVKGQADGAGVWGRANANGPGFAKLVHDLQAGINFTDINAAKPGDFLKFFWNQEIGAKERGHMVVFLGTEQKEGQLHIRYWSANTPDGYSERSVPLTKMHHLIFTRVTRPANFAHVGSLSTTDTWLQGMQKNSVSFDEVSRTCGIRETASGFETPSATKNANVSDVHPSH